MPDYSAYADLTVRRVYCEDLISNGNVGFGGNIAIGGSGYSTDIDLNLETTTLNSEAWGSMDTWLRKNFINTPPPPVTTGDTADTAKISFSWTNPAQLEAGFSDIKIPRIDTIKFEYKAFGQISGEYNSEEGEEIITRYINLSNKRPE